ncbi:hypothetical protein HPB51_014452 [Rhipicephalus microplus]|uniref:Obg domain-containing protein n=1 Tax=Rhipicephalus microplus TaxID=6941 RepID=A0A9J6D5E9_RHIMP|nr:hypothetical protein HPB51_014452 [Rhipicephalus microplus]
MVVLTTFCLYAAKETAKGPRLRDVGRFMDRLRLNIHGGTGGTGYPRYGGIGGSGGNVYLKAIEKMELKDVVKNYPDKRIKAGHGQNSKSTQILGSPGTDITVKVPVGVSVYNGQNHLIGDLIKPNDKILVVRGGQGGNPRNQYHGQKGEVDNITLNLKLIADVGFVGTEDIAAALIAAMTTYTAAVAKSCSGGSLSEAAQIMRAATHLSQQLASLASPSCMSCDTPVSTGAPTGELRDAQIRSRSSGFYHRALSRRPEIVRGTILMRQLYPVPTCPLSDIKLHWCTSSMGHRSSRAPQQNASPAALKSTSNAEPVLRLFAGIRRHNIIARGRGRSSDSEV